MFGQGGCNITFFYNQCFAKCGSYRFSTFANFVDFRKHCKIGILVHFEKQAIANKMHFEGLLSGPGRGYHLVQVGCV